jgi:hypothetical protein
MPKTAKLLTYHLRHVVTTAATSNIRHSIDSTHIRWLEERLEKNTVQKILQAEKGKIGKDKESMTEKKNQVKLIWFQTGGALNFITAAPHCGSLLTQ